MGNVVDCIDKSLGCLEKNRDLLCKEKKRKEKKKMNARKLLKKFYNKSDFIYGTIDRNWINWEANL